MKYNDKNKPLVCMMTQSTCYKGTRKFTPKGVLWHSTGANNPTLKRYVQPDDNASNRTELLSLLGKNAYGNDWNHIDRQAGLNFWIGKLADGTVAAVQTMPWDYRPWGCGSGSKGSCNDTHIQFEICEDALTDKSYWEACYKEACEMTAYLCKMFGIDPKGTISYNGLKVPTIIDHTGSHSMGLGSNHGDVQHWSRKYGVTMETVRNDVAALLAGDDSVVSTPVANTNLKKGSTGDAVKTMQTMLIACGYSCGSTGADGDFGKNTDAAVKAFQKDKGLTVDGVYGEQTKAALEKAYATSSASQPTIAINAEQAIWEFFMEKINNAFGASVMTFVGQNYGARRLERAEKSILVCSGLSCVSAWLFSFVFITFAPVIFRLFTKDPQVMEDALRMVRSLSPWYFLFVPIEMLSGALRGMGDTLIPTFLTALGICVFRSVWMFLVIPHWHEIEGITISYPISWVITGIAFILYYLYRRRKLGFPSLPLSGR